MSSAWRSILTLVSAAALASGCARQAGPAAAPGEAPAAREDGSAAALAAVRRGYFDRDWSGCARAGDELLARHPDSAPLRAWTILCLARSGGDALARADAMLAEKPGDPWGLLARAGALIDDPIRGEAEAIAAARAAAAALDHPDATWVVGRALLVHAAREEAGAFLAAEIERAPTPALLGLRLAWLAQSTDEVEARVTATAEQARALDPRSVDAYYQPARWLLNHHRPAEALPLLTRALELSPHAWPLHVALWDAIQRSSERDPAAKRAAIDADVARLLAARGDDPATVHAAAGVYEGMSPETYERLRDDLLARFPDSREAEWVRLARLRALQNKVYEARKKGERAAAADVQALQAALDAFLARPRHHDPHSLGSAHLIRYTLLEGEPDTTPEALRDAVRLLAAHERLNLHVHAAAAVVLAERTPYAAEAEAIARAGQAHVDGELARWRAWGMDAADREKNERFLRSQFQAALGAALFAQGRRAEAREALSQAYAQSPTYAELFVRLARLEEAEGRPAEAERWLTEGLALERGVKTCEDELRALYRRRHGSERGFERHRARLVAQVREKRRAAVLASARAEPKPLAPFVLERLGGGEVGSDALQGRVMVINVWAKWCGWCVKELPEVQQLADAFADDPGVVVTTINIDTVRDDLPAWLKERGHRFEVLLGARYIEEAGYRTFPVTLFVDREGRIVFEKEGATDRLVEEFTWRIEALRRAGRGRRSPT